MRAVTCRLMIAAVALAATPAFAIDNLKILVPANPGGGWDQTGRNLGAAMTSAKLVKGVQYDNKGGAGGTIGLANFVNAAKGDGAHLMIGGMVMVGAIELQKSPVTLAMVTPIARLTTEANAIVVPANSKIKSLKELVDQFKANPASVSWGGGSAGGTDHIMVGMIAKAVGADPAKINYVPFKGGGEALQAIIGGHVTAGVSGYGEFAEQIKAGKMRAIAVSGGTRIPGVDIPTLKEQGVDVEIGNWRGVFAGPGLSEKQRAELEKLVLDAIDTPAWKETLKKLDWTDVRLAGAPFRTFVGEESRRIAAILKDIGLAK